MTDLERINHMVYAAGERLHALRAEVHDFIESGGAYEFGRDYEPAESVRTFEVRAKPVPDEVILLTGEIATELWRALCDLGSLLSNDDLGDFPVTDTPEEFTAWMDAYLPDITNDERAAIEATQRYETADFFGVTRRIAERHEAGTLTGDVVITGDIRRSWPHGEVHTGPTEHPPLQHVIAPGHPWAGGIHNVHLHIGLVIEVLVGTPIPVTDQLEQTHMDVRSLVNALKLGPDEFREEGGGTT